jgi:hypothetical protein
MRLFLLVIAVIFSYGRPLSIWSRKLLTKSSLSILNSSTRLLATANSQQKLQEYTSFYNSLSKKKEIFKPLHPPKVSFYSCGPTVYDFAHIGNFRAFLTYDLIKRWLQYIGYNVDHVCNLTDVDDKIIAKMIKEGKSLEEITNYYSAAFFQDLQVSALTRKQKVS